MNYIFMLDERRTEIVKIKKTLGILMALILLLTFGACKKEPEKETTLTNPPSSSENDKAEGEEDAAPEPVDEPENPAEPMREAKADDTAMELLEANNILNLLSKHDSVTIELEGYASDNTLDNRSKYEYFNTAEGICAVQSHTQPEGSSAKSYSYQSKDVSGILFSVPAEGAEDEGEPLKTITLCPSNDYPQIVTMNQNLVHYNQATGSDTVTESTEEKDGRLILTEKTTTQGMPDYTKSVYIVNEESMEIEEATTTSYNTEDASIEWYSKVRVSFDQPHDEINPGILDQFINAQNGCELKLVINPGASNEETQDYRIPKDVMVYFQCASNIYELYSDKECTEPVSYIDVSRDKLEIYAKTM